jgi:hypothetical protein
MMMMMMMMIVMVMYPNRILRKVSRLTRFSSRKM